MRRVIAIAVTAGVVAAGTVSGGTASGSSTRTAPGRPISWLSLGDSYGAGEGATEATGFCQRSPNAAGPKAATILREERGWTISPETFSACTGYLAADMFTSRDDLTSGDGYSIFGGEPVEFDLENTDLARGQSLAAWVDAQAGTEMPKYDVISVSLGGNDIGFADIVKDCLWPRDFGNELWASFSTSYAYDAGCDDDLLDGGFTRRIDALFNDSTDDGFAGTPAKGDASGTPLGSLQQLYRAIEARFLAPGGVVVVMGYPRLITPSSTWQSWRGDQCNLVRREDADALGSGAEYFDRRMRTAVEQLGPEFVYLSRLDVFDDGTNHHSLCARGVEWLNTPLLFLRDGSGRLERGFHPNDLGYLATAERLAGIVEQRLGAQPEPTQTTTVEPVGVPGGSTQATVVVPPTVRSSEQHYDIGDEFEAQCTIAWPTAPSYGQGTIIMTTFCPSVPDQFLFVNIVYGDPDLPVAPLRSTMIVHGVITNIVRSTYGYTTLHVEADYIDCCTG